MSSRETQIFDVYRNFYKELKKLHPENRNAEIMDIAARLTQSYCIQGIELMIESTNEDIDGNARRVAL